MSVKLSLLILSALALHLQEARSVKILFFFGLESYSHRIAVQPLVNKLADKGHEVTIFAPGNPESPRANVTDIFPDFNNNHKDSGGVKAESIITGRLRDKFHDPVLSNMWDMSISRQAVLVQNEEFKSWVALAVYDLIIYSNAGNEIAAALAFKMKAKLIAFTTTGASPMFDIDIHGLPVESSWLPDWTLGSKYFFIPNHFMYAYNTISWYLSYKWSYLPRVNLLVQELYPQDDIPPVEELIRNVSLILLNEHYSTGYPRALPPFVIPVGGMYAKEAEGTLPKNLEDFLATAGPFVLVSLESVTHALNLEDKIQALVIKTLATFKSTNFVWEWKGEAPKNLSKNVFVTDDLDQNDILGHPKCKGFVTQGDQISVHQAAFHGIPMVVVPACSYQSFNARSIEYNGIGIYLELSEMSEETFAKAIRAILDDPPFSANAKQASARFKDRPLSPVATAVWWVEYALRHDTSHLKSPGVYQYWWQRRLLDFYIALFFVGILLILVRIYIGRLILRFAVRIFYTTKDKLKRS